MMVSPWENGYCEGFNGKLRDNLLDGEIFMSMKEAEIVIENWRRHYNGRRPHRSLGGRPPAPLAIFAPPIRRGNGKALASSGTICYTDAKGCPNIFESVAKE